MPIEPWWETNPATTQYQELDMVSPELHEPIGHRASPALSSSPLGTLALFPNLRPGNF